MKNRITIAAALGALILPTVSFAKESEGTRLAISQGISTPNTTSPVNLSHGFVPTNPAVAGSLNGVQVSLEYGTTDENNRKNSTAGVELGVGTGSVGIAAGYLKSDCNGCDGRAAGIVGVSLDSFSIGFGFGEDKNYSVGAVLNPKGEHRFGLVGSLSDSDQVGADLQTYGVGYSYHSGAFILSVDASKRKFETSSAADDIVIITPGLQVKADWISLMVSHDLYTNNEAKTFTDNTWFGIGIGDADKHLAIYHDYFHEWSLVGTLSF